MIDILTGPVRFAKEVLKALIIYVSVVAKGKEGVSFIFFEHGIDEEREDSELFFREDMLKALKELVYNLDICFKNAHVLCPLSVKWW
jgi:hypothetical protein